MMQSEMGNILCIFSYICYDVPLSLLRNYSEKVLSKGRSVMTLHVSVQAKALAARAEKFW